jgi:hypothetical protein
VKLKFVYLLTVSASILVCSAAYFSITGFVKLFSSEKVSIAILIGGLEFSKLVVTSFLYKYWDNIKFLFKFYLTLITLILMVITSSGIYGFLSSAYSYTSNKLAEIDGNILLYEKKKQMLYDYTDRIKINIIEKNKRIQSLTSIRFNQEARVDILYKKGLISSVRKTEQIIKEANLEINVSNIKIDSLNRIAQYNLDSIGKIDILILRLSSSNINGDIGPLKYIANLTGKNIDSVVNFFILLLVFISDPLALSLVIATNKVLSSEMEKNIIDKHDANDNRLLIDLKNYFKKFKKIFL